MESIKAKIGDQFYETGVHQINGEWLRVTVIDAKNFIKETRHEETRHEEGRGSD